MNLNSASITGLIQQKTAPGTYATGKGTTAKVKDYFSDLNCPYPVAEIASEIGVPSRQLSKRLAELVKTGFLTKTTEGFIRKASPLIDEYTTV